MKEKTYVEDVDRNMYDFRNDEKDAYRIKNGLTEDIVEKISEEKHDPEWMHDFRLNSLKVYNEMKVPDWGPSIEGLNMDNIATDLSWSPRLWMLKQISRFDISTLVGWANILRLPFAKISSASAISLARSLSCALRSRQRSVKVGQTP